MSSLCVLFSSRTGGAGKAGEYKSLLLESCGIAFLYERMVRLELREGRLRQINLRDLNIVHDFSFIWRCGSVFHREYEAAFRDLCEVSQKREPEGSVRWLTKKSGKFWRFAMAQVDSLYIDGSEHHKKEGLDVI